MRTLLLLCLMIAVVASSSDAAPPAVRPLKIGIIGTGHIGGTLA